MNSGCLKALLLSICCATLPVQSINVFIQPCQAVEQNTKSVRTTTEIAKPAATTSIAITNSDSAGKDKWWKHAVFYEIYPRSFADARDTGMGDIKGITSKLDYLKDLGVGAIWITPCYPSPQVDFGYDISDYETVAPEYGTMADFDQLVAEARKRDIKIIMDFVLNHT
jgi:alpha-glucosidase